jgi:hypothetical protein
MPVLSREWAIVMIENIKEWELAVWNAQYSVGYLPPMTEQEIRSAVKWLRKNNYPKPTDCPEQECPKYRPACKLGICNVAVGMCGDFR